MSTKQIIRSVALVSLLLFTSLASAQYEEEPFIEGFVGGNSTLPIGHIKDNLEPDSLNAKAGFGLDLGGGYYFNSHLVAGLYFSVRNMAAKDFSLTHRVFEFGAYGKYLLMDLTEASLSPYLKFSAGLNFSKLATKVFDDGQPVYRELSYSPTVGTSASLGLHWKINERGGVYLEAAYQFDVMNDVIGQFESVDYSWADNNTYIMLRAGIMFNIGPRE